MDMKSFQASRIALAQEMVNVSSLLASYEVTADNRPAELTRNAPTPADLGLPKKKDVLDAVLKLIKNIDNFADTYKDAMKLYFGADTDTFKKNYSENLRSWWRANNK